MPPALVLTRPDPAARRFARAARATGWAGAILFSPVLRIVHLPGGPLPPGTLIFTSENGVRAAERRGSLAGRCACAVGERTAAAARAAGARVGPVGTTMEALARLLLAQRGGAYVHCRGRHVSGDLAGRLSEAQMTVTEVVAYDQEARELGEAARAALMAERPVVLPLFSVRSARLTAAGLPAPPPSTTIVAISPAVAAAWPWPGAILTAKRPEAGAVLAEVRGLVGGGRGG